jgi:uncharacterized protein (TIGR02001 family)
LRPRAPRTRPPALAALCLLASLLPAAARAQLAASVSLESDYRVRGYSLTGGRPALSLGAFYDHPTGAYAGATLVAGQTPNSGAEVLGHIASVGYAARTSGGHTWDLGVSNLELKDHEPRTPRKIRYSEVYAGVGNDNLSLRVAYSPRYIRSGLKTVYVDLNGAVRPRESWRVFGHAGVLMATDGRLAGRRWRYDLRAGVAREFRRGDLYLAVTTRTPDHPPPGVRARDRNALVVGANYFF